jgi:ankyrin repeat protein
MNANVKLVLLCGVFLVGATGPLAFGQGAIPLEQAVKDGKAEVWIAGIGGSTGDAILITVRRKVPDVLRLTLTPGTVFKSVSGTVQNMVGVSIKGERIGDTSYRPAAEIVLTDNDKHNYVVEAYCLDFHKPNPGPSDAFAITVLDEPAATILQAAKNRSASIAAIQSALWISREHLTAAELKRRFPATDVDISVARAVLTDAAESLGRSPPTVSEKARSESSHPFFAHPTAVSPGTPYHFQPESESDAYQYVGKAVVTRNVEVVGIGNGMRTLRTFDGGLLNGVSPVQMVTSTGSRGYVANSQFSIEKPSTWADTLESVRSLEQRARTSKEMVLLPVPDAPGSKNIRLVVEKKVGFTRLAGLRFTDSCTVNIGKDGTVEVDKEGVQANDDSGTHYVSKKIRSGATDVVVMVAAVGQDTKQQSGRRPAAMIAGDAESAIQPGDTVVVANEGAKLMAGDTVIAVLTKGTEVKVVKVSGRWIAVAAVVKGASTVGWVSINDLKPLSNKAAPKAGTVTPPADTVSDTRIHDAATKGDFATVRAILEKQPEMVNARDNDGQTPLHIAAKNGRTEVARILLEKRADVNAKDRLQGTALHWAVAFGQPDVAEVLLAKGAEVDATMKTGFTPLHYAAWTGRKDLAEMLITKGAAVDRKSTSGCTPLHLAASRGKREVAKLLVAKGARTDIKDETGTTPLAYAIASGQKDFASILQSATTVNQKLAPSRDSLSFEKPTQARNGVTIYAFFANAAKSQGAPRLDDRNRWIEAVRKKHNLPGASVELVQHSEWQAPMLTTADHAEVAKTEQEAISGVRKELLQRGVPAAEVDVAIAAFYAQPLPQTGRVIYTVVIRHR